MTAGLPRSEQSGESLYIINLCSSTTPMALVAPDIPELGGYAVFRSRRHEDGRDRFRLHLGYFDSQEQAEGLLEQVRTQYPAAWVALAPRDSMGSLDDTSVAQFKYIKQRQPDKQAARPAVQPVAKPPAPAIPVAIQEALLKPQEVLTLLESPPAPEPMRAEPVAAQPEILAVEKPAIPATAAMPQQFAVQLLWTTERVDSKHCPQMAIFGAYTLYTVQVQRGGRRWYGLRLGFFGDPISARQVALYAKGDYDAATVVPVSDRECQRAIEAAEAALKQPVKVTAPAPQAKPKPKREAPRQTMALIDEPLADVAMPEKTRVVKRGHSAEDLMDELGASTLSLTENKDELSDTGVRHLQVSVVKRKPRLFSRTGTR